MTVILIMFGSNDDNDRQQQSSYSSNNGGKKQIYSPSKKSVLTINQKAMATPRTRTPVTVAKTGAMHHRTTTKRPAIAAVIEEA
jgi:hypothetical protein